MVKGHPRMSVVYQAELNTSMIGAGHKVPRDQGGGN